MSPITKTVTPLFKCSVKCLKGFYICDLSEQKQPFGCRLTNPLNDTPLRPGSTFIDGFSKLIPQRIAVEISYLLVYCP